MNEGDQRDRFLIFGFLRKILNKEESEGLQERMKDDTFQEEMSEETVNQYGRIQLNSKLDELHLNVEAAQKKRLIFNYILMSFLVALLAIFCWKFFMKSDNLPELKPDQVFASYFEPYASLFEQKGETTNEEIGLYAAMKAYTDQDYKKAVLLFESNLSKSNSKNSLQSFYYGIALLANEESAKAQEVLLQLKDGPSSLVPKEPLYWYLALSYVQENNITDAIPLLEWVATRKNKSFKQKEATEILKTLKTK